MSKEATPSVTIPKRTCVGCRTRRPKAELLWLRRRPDGAIELRSTRNPGRGRGAYLCPTKACMTTAATRGALARSFRARVRFDAETFCSQHGGEI